MTFKKIKIAQLIENPSKLYGGTLKARTEGYQDTCPGDRNDTKSPLGDTKRPTLDCDPPTLNDVCAIGDISS